MSKPDHRFAVHYANGKIYYSYQYKDGRVYENSLYSLCAIMGVIMRSIMINERTFIRGQQPEPGGLRVIEGGKE